MVTRGELTRGDVHLVILDPTVGSEIRKTRPCVVVSPNELNRHLRTAIVAPLTTGGRAYPWRIPCRFQRRAGFVALDQIRTVDVDRLSVAWASRIAHPGGRAAVPAGDVRGVDQRPETPRAIAKVGLPSSADASCAGARIIYARKHNDTENRCCLVSRQRRCYRLVRMVRHVEVRRCRACSRSCPAALRAGPLPLPSVETVLPSHHGRCRSRRGARRCAC